MIIYGYMNLYKTGVRALFISLVFFTMFSVSVTRASTLDSLTEKINYFITYINNNITEQIRKDFCIQYFSAISNGEWKSDEFRVKFGNNVCAGKEDKYLTLTEENKIKTDSTVTPIVEEKKEVVKNSLLSEPLVQNDNQNDNLILNDGQIIYWTNIERSKNATGLVQLKTNDELTKIAKERVKDMFIKNYFEHVSPSGDSVSKIADRNNYKYITIGENIALGNFSGSRELVQAWMNSEGHRENILNKNYTEIGVYSEEGEYSGKKVWISAQIFSRPMSLCVEPDISKKETVEKETNSLNVLKLKISSVESELKKISTSDIKKYNEKAAEYNNLAHTFNGLITDMKNIVTLYNKEVQDFNECIKTN